MQFHWRTDAVHKRPNYLTFIPSDAPCELFLQFITESLVSDSGVEITVTNPQTGVTKTWRQIPFKKPE